MKIWSIVTADNELEIEVSNCTLLYNQQMVWNRLIRQVDEFFNSRNSSIEMFEGGLPINKKDWNCFFIPFDAEVQLSKITANSPLKDIQSDIINQLMYSPVFQELTEVWEQLADELGFTNQQLGKWGIRARLHPFTDKAISNHVSFDPLENNLSPIEVKTLLLNLILERSMEKKTLIIIELPELFASESELQELKVTVDKAAAKGYKFLFVSRDKRFGVTNYYFKGKVIHTALLEQIKSKVRNEVPFYCSEDQYEQAKEILLNLVDNSNSEEEIGRLVSENRGVIVTIIYVIMYNLDIEVIQVPQGIEPNLHKFISDLR